MKTGSLHFENEHVLQDDSKYVCEVIQRRWFTSVLVIFHIVDFNFYVLANYGNKFILAF